MIKFILPLISAFFAAALTAAGAAADPDPHPLWSFHFVNGSALQYEPGRGMWFFHAALPKAPILLKPGRVDYFESTSDLYDVGELNHYDILENIVHMSTVKKGRISFFVNEQGVYAVSQWGRALLL